MKVSEFLSSKVKDVPTFLLGAFYGCYKFSADNRYIYTYSTNKNWTKLYNDKALCQKAKESFIHLANVISSPYSFWQKGNKAFPKADVVFALENDEQLNSDSFFNKLRRKIFDSEFIYEPQLTEDKKMFIRGFSELRASFDRNRKLLTMDYLKSSPAQTKRVSLLIDNLNVPVYVVNYNFREFQPEFKQGKKRETQLRYNIYWYATNIGFLNEYRVAAFKRNFKFSEITKNGLITYFICAQPLKSDSVSFENRLAYYTHNVFNKKLTKTDTLKFYELIGRTDQIDTFKRDLSIVNYVRYCTDDVCVCCCDEYNIEDRTHVEPKTGRYHFEIHHMISLGKNKQLDNVDNLAKICPACHASLGRGRASESYQKELIRKIFKHKPNIYEFSKSYFDQTDFEQVVDLVWQALK